MSYYLAKTVGMPFDEAVARTAEALKQEGFGIITEIDTGVGPSTRSTWTSAPIASSGLEHGASL
ncbi:hypothetical protein [Microvirga sp. KLBC 81]|uniref:hypothetical protein n=1 Tax=Microvirga sp. KLBC 81 TaxID=1862707 RepID=UPI001FDF2D16|nr:hypothetical protein [Microvirga sp. KLBC 81]